MTISTSKSLDRPPAEAAAALRTFSVVAAQDTPFYGSFTVEAPTPQAALALATSTLRDNLGLLSHPESEGAHSLRIVALQEADQDPLYADVALDADAPLWPGREARAALLGSTSALAQLLASLGEASAYPAELDQLSANLACLDIDPESVVALRALRAAVSPEAWVEQVMVWALEQTEAANATRR